MLPKHRSKELLGDTLTVLLTLLLIIQASRLVMTSAIRNSFESHYFQQATLHPFSGGEPEVSRPTGMEILLMGLRNKLEYLIEELKELGTTEEELSFIQFPYENRDLVAILAPIRPQNEETLLQLLELSTQEEGFVTAFTTLYDRQDEGYLTVVFETAA